MDAFLEFFSTLPQFQTSDLKASVLHLGTGCVLSKYPSDEPKYTGVLLARWPGQPQDEICPIDGFKAAKFYMREAISLGESKDRVIEAVEQLERSMRPDSLK